MAKAARKASDSFIVIDKGLRILITPSDGWYAVQGLDIRGLNTQGRTIEEAIYMAHDAAKLLAESRTIMAKETAREISSAPQHKSRRRQAAGAK